MNCPHCQAENEENAEVCSVCGKSFLTPVETSQPPEENVVELSPVDEQLNPEQVISTRRKFPILGVILFTFLVLAAGAAVLLVPGLFNSSEKPILFTVISNNPQGMAIFTSDPLMKQSQQVVLNDSGLMLPFCGYYGNENAFLSPDKQFIAMASGSEMSRISLFSVANRTKTLLSETAIPPYGLPVQGFSPRGKYFGFTILNSEDKSANVQIVDMQGKVLLDLPGAIYGGFAPDESKVVLLAYDMKEVSVVGLDLVELPGGKRSRLVDVDFGGEMEVGLFAHPFFSPDGKEIFYVRLDTLYQVPLSGGNANPVYEFQGGSGVAFLSPRQDNLVLVDMEDEIPGTVVQQAVLANISLYQLKTKKIIPVAEKIIYSMASKDLPIICEQSFTFSPDQQKIAFKGIAEDTGQLIVSNTDGNNKIVLTPSMDLSLEFSADSKSLIYLSRQEPYGADILFGDLYIASLDGKDASLLDNNVWSFSLANGGKEILYVKVDLPNNQTFTSEVYKINADGTGKVLVMGAKDGIYTFLKD